MAQGRQIADQVGPKLRKLTALLDEGEENVLAYMTFPNELTTASASRPLPATRLRRGGNLPRDRSAGGRGGSGCWRR